ncbi:MAG: hypothetical protein L6422_02940 [Candidatus Marinimicrobia bacterium]|nr:hypothetical protein [bacterium]MCG2715235.1 hypothetical protein [Candidatus Neomarinimicrobiota bacterium]
MMKKYLSQKELLEETGICFYRLEYLIKKGEVPVTQNGSGNPRKFPNPEAVEIIKARLEKLNASE